MSSWKLSKAAVQLREQFDDCYPERDRTSDGTRGDDRHSNTKSDHNPDKNGWVRALDIDADLLKKQPEEMAYIVNQLCRIARKDGRLSYIIYNGKITSSKSLWRWVRYRGINPHTKHAHFSFKKSADNNGKFFDVPMLGGNLG